MIEVKPRARNIPKFRSIKFVANAFDVSERTVRRWIDGGNLRAHHIGGVVRISDDDLDEFIRVARNG